MVKLARSTQRSLILFCIVAGCAHNAPNRRPAEATQSSATGSEATCTSDEQDIEEINKLKEVMTSLPIKVRESLELDRKNQREHLRYFEALQVRGRTCEEYAKVKQAVDIVQGRLIDINHRLTGYKNQLETGNKLRGLNQSRLSTEKIFCVMDCESGERRPDRSFCARNCGITLSQAQLVYTLLIEDDADDTSDNCPDTRAENLEKLKSALGDFLAVLKDFGIRVEPFLKQALREYSEIKSYYERQQKKYEQLAQRFQGSGCQQQDQNLTGSLEDNLRRAWSFGENGNGMGTVFYIQGLRDGEGIPVTAQHVSGFGDQGRAARGRFSVIERNQEAERIDQQSGDISILYKKKINEGDVAVFPVRAGQYDAGQDVTLGDARPVNFALPVVEAERRPQIGQRFMIAGFPGNRENNFTTHRCVFRGYMAFADRRPNAGYLLYCPSAESAISGMSGGPMVDESGKVWGTIHAGDTLNKGLVIVSPIARNPQGEVEIGIRKPMLSDHCYRFNAQMQTERHRCQMFPNSRETQVP